MSACRHMIDWRCTHVEATAAYGERPSPGVCSICEHYSGPPRGAGDVVHAVAKATGVAALVRVATGGDCGCAKRRAALNAAIPMADPEPENR